MALADDITEAAAKALPVNRWDNIGPAGRKHHRERARRAVAAVLDTLAEYTAQVAQDFEAQGLGYACERNLEPHEMRKIAEDIRAEVGQP